MLIGNLTRDPELRYTPQGTAVCTFGLATNRSWVTSDGGERQEEAEFHRIVSWQKLAELCAQLLFKGRKVFVEGRLQTRSWTGKDGQERTTTEIVIDNMIVLDSKRREGEAMGPTGEGNLAPSADNQTMVKQTKNVKPSTKAAADKLTKEATEKSSSTKVSASAGVTADKTEGKSRPTSRGSSTGTSGEEVKADDIPF